MIKYLSLSRDMFRIGKVLLRELERFEAGKFPRRAFWTARTGLVALGKRQSVLSPNKYVIESLAYELVHLYPKRHLAIQEARLIISGLLMYYCAFLMKTTKRTEKLEQDFLDGSLKGREVVQV